MKLWKLHGTQPRFAACLRISTRWLQNGGAIAGSPGTIPDRCTP